MGGSLTNRDQLPAFIRRACCFPSAPLKSYTEVSLLEERNRMAYPANYRYTASMSGLSSRAPAAPIGITQLRPDTRSATLSTWTCPRWATRLLPALHSGSVESVKAVSDLYFARHRHGRRRERGAERRARQDQREASRKPGSSRLNWPTPAEFTPCSTQPPMRPLSRKKARRAALAVSFSPS